jgi:hypothetical protein
MTEENVQDTAQESPSNVVENKPESPSNDGLLSEVMAKKEKIKTLEAELAKRDADNEKRRTKKLEDEGKHKELIAEQSSTIENLNAKLESQTGIVNNYKQNLINGLASDDERKEYLSTKSVDFLEELTKEKNLMQPQTVSNPGESLGAVRKTVSTKSFADMNEAEKREWHKQMTTN